jgi:hypothetical protein
MQSRSIEDTIRFLSPSDSIIQIGWHEKMSMLNAKIILYFLENGQLGKDFTKALEIANAFFIFK